MRYHEDLWLVLGAGSPVVGLAATVAIVIAVRATQRTKPSAPIIGTTRDLARIAYGTAVAAFVIALAVLGVTLFSIDTGQDHVGGLAIWGLQASFLLVFLSTISSAAAVRPVPKPEAGSTQGPAVS
jgi:hypothetical protein